ncbi:MAG: prepilin-type N-terminal cleavage/methylation domain-containing protein [Planctomycetota bacterium]|jgi:prepilin-type N-terminal cleavage/methylation domain-containing protein
MIDRDAHPCRRRAFTLIESMATISVLAVLGSIASFLILDSVDGYTEAATSAQLHAELSIAMDRAMREIRKIELDAGATTPPGPNITDINAAGDNIQWTNTAVEAHSLYKSGSDLMLEVEGGGAAVLLSDVTAFAVQTYDEDDGPLANPLTGAACDDIRRVQLNVTIQRNGASESLRTKVFIRSTMSGADS